MVCTRSLSIFAKVRELGAGEKLLKVQQISDILTSNFERSGDQKGPADVRINQRKSFVCISFYSFPDLHGICDNLIQILFPFMLLTNNVNKKCRKNTNKFNMSYQRMKTERRKD